MQKPTSRWRRDLGEDPYFTDENIKEVEAVLDQYVARLRQLEDTEDQLTFELEIYEAVTALNRIGGLYGRYPDLIETMERDELAEFIINRAKEAGYNEHVDDITFDWRQW